jgi:hypothetical protein
MGPVENCTITLSAIQMGSSGVSASGQFNDSAVIIVFTEEFARAPGPQGGRGRKTVM